MLEVLELEDEGDPYAELEGADERPPKDDELVDLGAGVKSVNISHSESLLDLLLESRERRSSNPEFLQIQSECETLD